MGDAVGLTGDDQQAVVVKGCLDLRWPFLHHATGQGKDNRLGAFQQIVEYVFLDTGMKAGDDTGAFFPLFNGPVKGFEDNRCRTFARAEEGNLVQYQQVVIAKGMKGASLVIAASPCGLFPCQFNSQMQAGTQQFHRRQFG